MSLNLPKGYTMRSVRIVLDEEKILREGKYKLDEIAQKSRLTKQDKFTYLSSGDENDLGRVALFTIHYATENEAITHNVKEWFWLDNGVPYINVIDKLKHKRASA